MVQKDGKVRQKGKLAKYDYDLRIITKQGKTKWVELFGRNIIYNNRQAGLISVLDITKKKPMNLYSVEKIANKL